MSPPPSQSPRRIGIGRFLIAVIALECLVLGANQVRRWIGHEEPSPGAHGTPAPDPERSGRASTVPDIAPAPMAGSAHGTAPSPQTQSDADGVRPGGSLAGDDPRRRASDRAAGSAGPDRERQGAPPGSADRPVGMAAGSPSAGRETAGSVTSARPAAAGSGTASGGAPGDGASPNDVQAQAPGGPASLAAGATASTAPILIPQGNTVPEAAEDKPDDKDEDKDEEEPDPSGEEDPDQSGADSAPPVLESLRFDPPQVEGGSVTTLTVQASDVKSGMKSIWGEVRSPNRSAVIGFGSASLGIGAAAFTFSIALPAAAQTGTWYVTWISLTDMAGNTKLIQAPSAAAAPPGGTFQAFSSDSDATPPEVLRVWFDKSAVAPGEKNAITVEARDDRSGVGSVMGACQSPSKSALVWFSGVAKEDSGAWVGEVTVPATADCGTWVLQQLAVKDKAGNTTLLQADAPVLARAGFGVVSGSNCDFTAPILESFDLSPAVVPSGTASVILVTANVRDEGSGTVMVTGWFDGPPPPGGGQAPRNFFNCSGDAGNPGAPWTCRVQVPQGAARGIWKVGSLRLEDKAKNSRTYTSTDPGLSGRVFQVQ